MKYRRYALLFLMVQIMLTGTVMIAGCTANTGNFNVSGQENSYGNLHFSIYTAEDIKNLVTTDDKLVINYYDAYTWVVFLGIDDSIDRMIYIYEFESQDKAEEMLSVRSDELRKNKSMHLISSKCVENYVVIELTDSSFDSLCGDLLRSNFSQLIVTEP